MRILVHIACTALALIAAAAHAADPRPVLLTAERVWTGEPGPVPVHRRAGDRIAALRHVGFVMKGGTVLRRP